MKTLNFLSDFWQTAKKAIEEIETELPKVAKEDILKPVGDRMWVVQYKDLGDKWGAEELLKRYNGESNNLTLLAEKIREVFRKSPDKVVEFIQGVASRGYFDNYLTNKRTILTPNELTRLKFYIKENI